jgi:hypothetical protein
MTMIAPHAAGAWMSRTELAQASGLREDLIARFIPATDTPNGPMYPAQQMALAVYVKELTDHNLPPAAVDEKVREFNARPPVAPPGLSFPAAKPSRRGLWTAVGAAATAALIVGGAIGALIGSNGGSSPAVSAPPGPVEAQPPAQFTPAISAVPDPVCAEWAPIADANAAKQQEWSTKSVNQPASTWNAEQWDLNRAFIEVVRENVSDMKRLAEKAEDPFLAALMRAQAMYAEAFILRLPNYQPSDRPLWQASVDMSGAVRAACKTVQPR